MNYGATSGTQATKPVSPWNPNINSASEQISPRADILPHLNRVIMQEIQPSWQRSQEHVSDKRLRWISVKSPFYCGLDEFRKILSINSII